MTGPISEVPGFRRPELQEEPERAPRPSPLISAVPGLDPSVRESANVEREVVDAPPPPPAPEPVAPAPAPASEPVAPAPEPVVDVPAPVPDVVEPPEPVFGLWGAPGGEHLEEDVEATRAVRRPSMLVLRWDDGTVLEVSAPTVVGRDPVGANGEVAVALDDPTMSLSKTHARLVPGLAPTVEDLHSTNGVSIVRDGASLAVAPGQPAALRPGDEVVCGTRRASVEVRA
jgi:hypothetical protein